MKRIGQKTYIKIPGGEIQYGHTTKSVVMWFKGKRYNLYTSKLKRDFLRAGLKDDKERGRE